MLQFCAVKVFQSESKAYQIINSRLMVKGWSQMLYKMLIFPLFLFIKKAILATCRIFIIFVTTKRQKRLYKVPIS